MIHEQITKTFKEAIYKRFKRGSQLDNVYIPPKGIVCVKSSVNEGSNNFNETFQHIHEQLKPKK